MLPHIDILRRAIQHHAKDSTQNESVSDNNILHRIHNARDVGGEPLTAEVLLVSAVLHFFKRQTKTIIIISPFAVLKNITIDLLSLGIYAPGPQL